MLRWARRQEMVARVVKALELVVACVPVTGERQCHVSCSMRRTAQERPKHRREGGAEVTLGFQLSHVLGVPACVL